MADLSIDTVGKRRRFRPGEDVMGAAAWQLQKEADAVEVRLFWRTEGKGTQDVGVAATQRFDNTGLSEVREFRLKAPPGPYSFSGRLISLIWALEMVVLPGRDAERLDITISPTGQEVTLVGEKKNGA